MPADATVTNFEAYIRAIPPQDREHMEKFYAAMPAVVQKVIDDYPPGCPAETKDGGPAHAQFFVVGYGDRCRSCGGPVLVVSTVDPGEDPDRAVNTAMPVCLLHFKPPVLSDRYKKPLDG